MKKFGIYHSQNRKPFMMSFEDYCLIKAACEDRKSALPNIQTEIIKRYDKILGRLEEFASNAEAGRI